MSIDLTPYSLTQTTALIGDLARDLAAASTPSAALIRALESTNEALGFDYAEIWEPFGAGWGTQLSVSLPQEPSPYEKMATAGSELTQMQGSGLAGRALADGQTKWAEELNSDDTFLRKHVAGACGLESALALPVISDDEILAVVLLFSTSRVERDDALEAPLSGLASQLAVVLRHSRAAERYQQTIDMSPIPIAVHAEGVIRYANRAMGELLGVSKPEELIGKSMLEFVPVSDWEAVSERTTQALDDPFSMTDPFDPLTESTWLRPSGDEVDVEVVALPTTYEGAPALQVMARDVTERNRARAALKTSERRYRQIVESAIDGICLIDRDGLISYSNEQMAQMLGYESDDIVGRSLASVLRGVPIDFGSHDGDVWRDEIQFTRRDGSKGWAVVQAVSTNGSESDDVMVVSAKDVSGTRNAARQMRFQASILDQVQNAVIATDDDGQIVYWNTAAERAYGWRADEVLREPVLDVVIPGRLRTRAMEIVETTRMRGSWTGEFTNKRRDGSEFAALFSGASVLDDEDRVIGFAMVSTDISEQKETLARLKRLLTSKDEFIASVSHELRTPLTAVLGFAELLRSSDLPVDAEENAKMLETLTEQARSVSHIIDDLLVAARADDQLLTISPSSVVIRVQVEQALGNLEVADKELTTEIPPTLRVWADSARLRQILRNLIWNAVRYGGEHIHVLARESDDIVALEVRDNGDRISSEDVDRMFEPYATALRPGLTNPVGLGLTVSRQLAQLMNGRLTYHREDGWTVFRLELPESPNRPARSDSHDG